MNARKPFWILVILGFALILLSFGMRRSADPGMRDKATITGWSGVGIVLIGRIFFARRSKGREPSDTFPPKKQS